jgi:hypothetical protein
MRAAPLVPSQCVAMSTLPRLVIIGGTSLPKANSLILLVLTEFVFAF